MVGCIKEREEFLVKWGELGGGVIGKTDRVKTKKPESPAGGENGKKGRPSSKAESDGQRD